jgi:hypothetical protein
MKTTPHLSDRQLLMDLEGELSARESLVCREHWEACPACRARRQELESTIGQFDRARRNELDDRLPDPSVPRARLTARLRAETESPREQRGWVVALAALGVLAFGVLLSRGSNVRRHDGVVQAAIVSLPNPRLTPGVTLLVSRPALCAQSNPNNKVVPDALQRKVFAEYGIAGAPARAYEVDYLVTPALGGADDIHNLWPHSHSATIWNAQVKDALEDRLHEMVCAGSLELREAQQEIAADWIAAYRKYFHTDQPLPQHAKRREP